MNVVKYMPHSAGNTFSRPLDDVIYLKHKELNLRRTVPYLGSIERDLLSLNKVIRIGNGSECRSVPILENEISYQLK